LLRHLARTSIERLLRTVAIRAEPLALHAQLATKLHAMPADEKTVDAQPLTPGTAAAAAANDFTMLLQHMRGGTALVPG
jgi:hypothetical protein